MAVGEQEAGEHFPNLKTCFRICRDVLSSRMLAVKAGSPTAATPGLSEETVAAVGYLIDRGIVLSQDWHPIRTLYGNGLIAAPGQVLTERKAMAAKILARIKPTLSKLNAVDQHILPHYVDDVVLLVFEFAAWSWVQEVEMLNTVQLIKDGRKPSKRFNGALDSFVAESKFKLKTPLCVLEESTKAIADHRKRIKWARSKINAARRISDRGGSLDVADKVEV